MFLSLALAVYSLMYSALWYAYIVCLYCKECLIQLFLLNFAPFTRGMVVSCNSYSVVKNVKTIFQLTILSTENNGH